MAGPYTLTGTGVQSLASPGGLSVAVLAYPQGAQTGQANPVNFYHLGLLRLGTADGYLPAFPIDASSQLVPCPRAAVNLGYSLNSGVQLRVTELAHNPMWQLDPWDRSPTSFQVGSSAYVPAAGGSLNLWTYTVPSGQLLWLASAWTYLYRQYGANTNNPNYAAITRNGVTIISAALIGNTVGQLDRSTLGGGPLILAANETIQAVLQGGDTPGNTIIGVAAASGFLFGA